MVESQSSPKNKESVKARRKYPFLIKMVLTIYLFICVPMIFIQVFTLYSSYHELSSQNDIYCFTETQNLSSRIMAQISAFRTIALKINATSPTQIKEFFNPNTPENILLDVSKELSSYSISVPAARHFGLYYADRELFINESFYYKLDNFCTAFAMGDPDTYNKVYSLFTQPSQNRFQIISSFSPDDLNKAEMIVASPIKINGYDAVLYFSMTYSSLNSFLATSFSENSTFAMFGEDGNILYTNSTANLDELQSHEFSDFLLNNRENKYAFDSNGSVAYKWQEDGAPYTFISIVAVSQFEENSTTFFHTMQLSLLANIILTIIMVAVTSYINYNPLRKLVSRIPKRNEQAPISELGQIESAIAQLDTLASDQSMVIMEYVLNDLLYGTSIRQQGYEDLIPNLDCEYFCAASVVCTRPTTEQSRRISAQILKETDCHIFITDMPNKEYCLFICLSKPEIVPETLSQAISDAVQSVLGESCQIHMGTIVKSLDDIPLSYYASQAETGEQSSLIYAQDYPSKEIKVFIRQIETANFPAARESLESIFSYVQQNKQNRPLYRYICYEVMVGYVSARQCTSYPMTDAEQQNLLAFTNAEHLQQELEQSMAAMEKQISLESNNEDIKFQNDIVEFVNENYNQSDISLINVADRFGISIYTLSRVFKARTGIGFKEYITAKRLELACRLLITTKDNISVIAQNSGFDSPTYFASIFKAHYGMTPSKFRGNSV